MGFVEHGLDLVVDFPDPGMLGRKIDQQGLPLQQQIAQFGFQPVNRRAGSGGKKAVVDLAGRADFIGLKHLKLGFDFGHIQFVFFILAFDRIQPVQRVLGLGIQ